MITFKNIAGNKFLAVGTIQRKSALNGEKSLTGTLYDGKDVLNKIDKGWSLEFDGEPYVVTYFERNDNDNSVSFDAIHKFFWDMAKKVLYSSTEISGSHTIKWYLDQIFANTGYTYALNFSPAAIEKDNWGNKTRLSLFNDLITSIAGEFEINGTLISIFKNIGTDLSTIVRYGFNLSDMTIENDATSFVTYGEGFGAYADQENQTGDRVHVTYTSPLASVYGILQAEPIDDQRYTSQANLLSAVKAQVDASFSVSVQLSLYDLTAAGYPYKMANVGDWLTAVDENLDFKQRIRIISIDDEFSADGTRISYTVTAGGVGLTKKYQDANASMASQIANAVASASQASTDANNALISANGKNTSYYLNSVDDLPTMANEGDLAWVKSGDGTVMYIYTKKADGSYYWEKRIDPEIGDQITAGVTEAVTQAKSHTDEVKQSLSTDIATAKSQAASQASTAEANANSYATSQFNQAQSALSDAKTELNNSIASAANTAQQNAIDVASKSLGTYLVRLLSGTNIFKTTNSTTIQAQVWKSGQDITSTIATSAFTWTLVKDGGTASTFATGKTSVTASPSDFTNTGVYAVKVVIPVIDTTGTTRNQTFTDSTTIAKVVDGTQGTDGVGIKSTSITYSTSASGTIAPTSGYISTIPNVPKGMFLWQRTTTTLTDNTTKTSDIVTYFAKDGLNGNDGMDGGQGMIASPTKPTTGLVDGFLWLDTSQTYPVYYVYDSSIKDFKIYQFNAKNINADQLKAKFVGTDRLSASQIIADDLHVKSANIDGNLTASQITVSSTNGSQTSLAQFNLGEMSQTISDTKNTVNGLGQVNQLFNTEFSPDLANWTQVSTSYRTTGATRYGSTILKVVSDDGDYFYQDIPVSSGVVSFSSIMQLDGGFTGNFRFGINFRDSNHAYIAAGGNVWGTNNTSAISYTLQKVENISVPTGSAYVRINYQFRGTGSGRIIQPMLVFSDHVGTYVQGNYNNNSAIAKAQLTADNSALSLSNYKTDADGRIRKAQADIKANADSINKKVSQTDYDQKTGDLSTKLNNTTDTANSTKQELSDYKEYANGNISGVSSNLDKLAGKVDLKLTKTEYDNDQSTLNSSLSQWKADYDGWTGTVSRLSTTVNSMGQVNQLFNTEFSPNFQSWTQVSTAYRTTGNTRNGSNVVKVVGDDGDYLYQDVAVSAGVVSFSSIMEVDSGLSGNFRFGINFRDSDHNYVSAGGTTWGTNNTGALNYTLQKLENIAVPTGAAYVRINYQFRGTGVARFFQPMLVFSDHVGAYVQGNYNNNSALAQVKITADSISNFVRDSSGNLSSDFQTALSKTSIITGSTLATSIQQQTATQISSALTDNNGKIISLINQDTSGVQIAGKNLAITADTTVDGNFWAKQVNAVQVNASNITVGTLNGNQVNITNINANNIVTGVLTGITLMSSSNGSQFKVQGNNLQMIKQNGDNLQLSTDGLFWKDSSGNVLFEASNKITTSDIFGTAEYNVYLASLNETRSVTYATALTGSGGVSDYNYVPHRAGGVYTTWVEVNTSGGNENVYIRPLKAESEVRITASGGTDSYANLRARYVYANRIAINSRTDAQQLYLQTGDEVRVKSTNDDVDNSGYKAIRASAFNSASLAKYKQNIEVSSISGLDEVNNSTIYNYQLKTSPDKQEVGLVIGDDYKISQVVVDGDGVNQYRMVSIAWKAIQELTQQVNELKQELESEGK